MEIAEAIDVESPAEYHYDADVVQRRFKRRGLFGKSARTLAPHVTSGHTMTREYFSSRKRGELRGQTEVYLHRKTKANNPGELLDWYKTKYPQLKDVRLAGLDLRGDRGDIRLRGRGKGRSRVLKGQ